MEKKSDNKWIIRNLLMGVAFVAVLLLLVQLFLTIRTRHGRSITVPDMVALSYEDASRVASAAGVKLSIMDSLYMHGMPRGAVINQNPKAGSKVKPGRTISIVTNSIVPKKVKMPSLVGVSLRQALAELHSKGLVVGRLQYVSDMATNNVLRQQYRGRDIKPGKEIVSGSSIDLVLGLNGTDGTTYIPNLKGYKYDSVLDAIHDNSLNVGRVSFDETVKTYADSVNAVVYRQTPVADGTLVVMGKSVSVSLTLDESKLESQE